MKSRTIKVNGIEIRDAMVVNDNENYFVVVPKDVVNAGTDGKMNRQIMAMMSGKQVKGWIAVMKRVE